MLKYALQQARRCQHAATQRHGENGAGSTDSAARAVAIATSLRKATVTAEAAMQSLGLITATRPRLILLAQKEGVWRLGLDDSAADEAEAAAGARTLRLAPNELAFAADAEEAAAAAASVLCEERKQNSVRGGGGSGSSDGGSGGGGTQHTPSRLRFRTLRSLLETLEAAEERFNEQQHERLAAAARQRARNRMEQRDSSLGGDDDGEEDGYGLASLGRRRGGRPLDLDTDEEDMLALSNYSDEDAEAVEMDSSAARRGVRGDLDGTGSCVAGGIAQANVSTLLALSQSVGIGGAVGAAAASAARLRGGAVAVLGTALRQVRLAACAPAAVRELPASLVLARAI